MNADPALTRAQTYRLTVEDFMLLDRAGAFRKHHNERDKVALGERVAAVTIAELGVETDGI